MTNQKLEKTDVLIRPPIRLAHSNYHARSNVTKAPMQLYII